MIIVGTVPDGSRIKAAVGTISEQSGTKLPGQYLPGGEMQAVLDMSKDANAVLSKIADEVVKTSKPGAWIDPATGMRFEIRPTGWKDANGIHGYIHMPGVAAVQTVRLGAREQASKDHREVTP